MTFEMTYLFKFEISMLNSILLLTGSLHFDANIFDVFLYVVSAYSNNFEQVTPNSYSGKTN